MATRAKQSALWCVLRLAASALFLISSVHAASVAYTYDSLNRITKADYGNGVVASYTYDASGNRLGRGISGAIIGTVPGAPTAVSATAGDASASVSFTVPANNGSAISGYSVTSNPSGITATGTASPITVTRLTNGTAYTFTVTATNAGGTSLPSSASNSATPGGTSGSTTSTTTTSSTTTTTASTTTTTLAGGGTTANVVSGWNLLGNGMSNAITVASKFGDSSLVITVWKWIAASNAWAFYTPSLADGGAAYAAGKGYTVLTTINAGEGFWVNAKSPFNMQLPAGTAVSSTSFQNMASGWNLIAIGDGKTPSLFNQALSITPPQVGVIPLNLTTLWAWDAARTDWYFYAPSLEANGGLANYIAGKGYLDFTANNKTLGPGAGFWVNKP